MTSVQFVDSVIEELNKARKAYYNGQESVMTDKEYDDKLAQLAELQKELNYYPDNSPVGKVGAATSDKSRDVMHEIRARSLDKTKDPNEIIKRLQDDRCKSVVAMWKLDGCTVVLTYVDGDLMLAATRGDGEIGTNITANTKYIKGIPQHIDGCKGKLIVRGECIITYPDFNEINKNLPIGVEPYANPRNLASASVSMPCPEDMKDRCLQFRAFDVISDNSSFPSELAEQFCYLRDYQFGVVPFEICNIADIPKVIQEFSGEVSDFNIPVDGLVFALNNRNVSKDLPGTEHHPDPKYGYAFKCADEVKETTLRDIEWSPSRTGLLNPVAVFDSVQLEGTTVSRASLHNLSYMKQKFLAKGAKVRVYKSNKIIPQILDNVLVPVDEDEEMTLEIAINNSVPNTCPTCRGLVEIRNNNGIETVWCANPDCPEKLIGNMAHLCSRDGLDIDGWSEETIWKLVSLHFVKEYEDIFKLDQHPELAFVPGFGKRSWEKLCQSAETARNTTFVKFVSALSIPSIGKGQAKTLKKYIDSHIEELQSFTGIKKYCPFDILVEMGLREYPFTYIEGFGSVLATNLTEWIWKNFRRAENSPYKRLLAQITFTDLAPVMDNFMNPPADSKVAGKSFCITGKLIHYSNREELVNVIEANGGKWIDSVSSKTNYLINNDVNSTSGKNKKAHDLNIPIISEEDFLAMLH